MPQPQMRLRASHLGFTSLKQLNLDPDQTPEEGGEPQHDQAEERGAGEGEQRLHGSQNQQKPL